MPRPVDRGAEDRSRAATAASRSDCSTYGLRNAVDKVCRGLTQYLTSPWPHASYTRADCARWLAGDPGTHSCVTAMLADHAGDFLLQAAAAGLLGLLALAGYFVLRRRWRDRATLTALPAGTAEALGTALAAVAAMACIGTAFDTEMTQRGIGAGEPWSLGMAAVAAAAVFAVALRRTLRRARPR